MTGLMWGFIKKFGGWILAALSLLAAFVTIWQSSKRIGKAEANADAEKQRTKDNEAAAVRLVNEARVSAEIEVASIKAASDVKNDVIKLNDGDADKLLRDEWQRD